MTLESGRAQDYGPLPTRSGVATQGAGNVAYEAPIRRGCCCVARQRTDSAVASPTPQDQVTGSGKLEFGVKFGQAIINGHGSATHARGLIKLRLPIKPASGLRQLRPLSERPYVEEHRAELNGPTGAAFE